MIRLNDPLTPRCWAKDLGTVGAVTGALRASSIVTIAVAVATVLAYGRPAVAETVDGGTAVGTDAAAGPASPGVRKHQSESNVTKETGPASSDSNSGDGQRVNDSYQPKGYDLGEFLLLPKIEIEDKYNSNVYATHKDVKSDLVTAVRPEINLRSQFSEHELNFGLSAEQSLYANYTRDNRLNVNGDINGRYDFSKETQANFSTQAYISHEDRSSPNTVQGKDPTPVQGVINRADVKVQIDRISMLAEVGVDRLTYDNAKTSTGSVIPNSDRDRWELSLRERASYEMFPGYAAVAQVTENTHIFDQSVDRSGYDRSSTGYRAETGVGVDLSKLVRGDFLLGYFQQYYNDARLKDASGLSMRATFNWTPSKLTIVIPSIDRTVSDTTTAQASSFDRTSVTLTVRHELERNIILTGMGGVYYDQLAGVKNQDDITYTGNARVIYAFSPELYVGGEVGFMSKQSQTSSQSFDQVTAMVKVGIQY